MSNFEVLAKLDARHKKIAESPWGVGREQKSAIDRMLGALDNPFSEYVNLTAAEREMVRAQWTDLAKQASRSPIKKIRKNGKKPLVPSEVLDFFGDSECIPHYPRATNDYSKGMRRKSWEKARTCASVELNPPDQIYWLIFDCDHENSTRWKDVGLPEPAFVTINRDNLHHHVVYRLRDPVCRSSNARQKPLDFLRAVKLAIRKALDADPNYVELLTKNPLSGHWQTVCSAEIPRYSLHELSSTLTLKAGSSPRKPNPGVNELHDVGVGSRNRALFDAVRLSIQADPAKLSNINNYALQRNEEFPQPLSVSEVNRICKSIKDHMENPLKARKYCGFSEKQAARGRLGGRPKKTADTKPWIAAGVSRATWYRQRKAKFELKEIE